MWLLILCGNVIYCVLLSIHNWISK